MPMNCPSCGRALASGAKCVYCAQGGTAYKKREQLNIPQGTTKAPKKAFAMPWKTIFVVILIVAGVMVVRQNPEWMAKFRELIKF